MIFKETSLKGAYIIELNQLEDERGFFSRTFCQDEFKKYNLEYNIAQCNISFNKLKGTLRGMHYQVTPYEEAKLVRCIRGSIYDVIIDIRKDSETYLKWISVELSENNYLSLYIPKGFAHGFQTLEDNTDVFYQMYQMYQPNSASGIRYNDTIFNIKWPLEITSISDRDKNYDFFEI